MDSILTWLRYQSWFISLNKELARGSSETTGVYLVIGVFIIAILILILLLASPSDNYYDD
jgi:tetrahydromethanopterin S-methyltransferase subunit F